MKKYTKPAIEILQISKAYLMAGSIEATTPDVEFEEEERNGLLPTGTDGRWIPIQEVDQEVDDDIILNFQ